MNLDPGNDKPIGSYDDLLSLFHGAIRPTSEHRIGAEMEKFGVLPGGRPLPYEGEGSVGELMAELASTKGWTPEAETEGGPVIALLRSGASITLEPGSQFELSGAPLADCHQIHTELEDHLRELRPYSDRHDVRWLGLGFHPFARREDYVMVPKQRYGVMRDYLPTKGSLALDMMLRTATVQANFDYASEADAMRKMRVGLRLAALTTAMFANSPFVEGAAFGGKSFRAKVWLDTDGDRSGLVPSLWKRNANFIDYVEWALDVPMFMIKREGKKLANTGQTFRSFFKSGFQGHRALLSDWQAHLNTLFPEVRLKKTIEVRGADSQGTDLATALPALYTGIFYDEKALGEAEALTQDWTLDEVAGSRKEVWQKGLGARFRAGTLQAMAEKILTIAEAGLERRAILSPAGEDERVYLSRLKALVGEGKTPADALLEGIDYVRDLTSEIVRRSALPLPE